MSLKSQSHFISPLTGKEVSKATYYRHQKKALFQTRKLVDQLDKEYKKESQSHDVYQDDDGIYRDHQSQSHYVTAEERIRIMEPENAERRIEQMKSQSQSQFHDYHDSDDFKQFMDSVLYQGKYEELQIVFKNLFLAASSRGIPKKIIRECEKFL